MIIADAARDAVTFPQFGGSRITGAHGFAPSEIVELDDLVPVGRVGELEAEISA